MPEHDLLMQLNSDIKEVCRAVGRIEEKVDNSIHSSKKHCDEMETLDDRVSFLERCRMFDKGIAAGISLFVTGLAWVLMWLKGIIWQ